MQRKPSLPDLIKKDIFPMGLNSLNPHTDALKGTLEAIEAKELTGINWREVDELRARIRDCEALQEILEATSEQ